MWWSERCGVPPVKERAALAFRSLSLAAPAAAERKKHADLIERDLRSLRGEGEICGGAGSFRVQHSEGVDAAESLKFSRVGERTIGL